VVIPIVDCIAKRQIHIKLLAYRLSEITSNCSHNLIYVENIPIFVFSIVMELN